MTVLFLSTQFTSLDSPFGLSIGLVDHRAGIELYLEVDLQTLPGRLLEDRCSEFVRSNVLPQFRRRPTGITHPAVLGRRLGHWLIELDEPRIEVTFDSGVDLALLRNWLNRSGVEDRVARDALARLVPTFAERHRVAERRRAAMEVSWVVSSASEGIGRHHALADARAFKAAFSVSSP